MSGYNDEEQLMDNTVSFLLITLKILYHLHLIPPRFCCLMNILKFKKNIKKNTFSPDMIFMCLIKEVVVYKRSKEFSFAQFA